MELDQVPGRHILLNLASLARQVPGEHLRRRYGVAVTAFSQRDRQRYIGLVERRNLVMVSGFGIGLVGGSIRQVQVQQLRTFADQDALPGQSNGRRGWIADVRDKYALPDGGALRGLYVLNIKHELGKALVEDSRLHFERRLRRLEPVLEPAQGGLRFGREVHGIEHRQHPGGHGEDGNDPQECPDADAAGPHRSDLTVGRQPAQPDQNSDEHTHGDGVSKSHRQREDEDFDHAGQRCAVAHDQVENVAQVPSEEDECEHRNADGGMRDHFTQNVPGQNAHRPNLKGENSTGCWGGHFLSAAFDFRFCLERRVDLDGLLQLQAKSTSKATDKSVRPTQHYSTFRKSADSGGRVRLTEKGRPWVG